MTKNGVYPLKKPSQSQGSDTLYDLAVGVSCMACLGILICISLILILHFSIERDPTFESSDSGLIL